MKHKRKWAEENLCKEKAPVRKQRYSARSWDKGEEGEQRELGLKFSLMGINRERSQTFSLILRKVPVLRSNQASCIGSTAVGTRGGGSDCRIDRGVRRSLMK